jgi:hypothetical protein
VDTRAYSPARNIFAGSWRWPKTLFDLAVSEARLAVTSRGPMRRGFKLSCSAKQESFYYAAMASRARVLR